MWRNLCIPILIVLTIVTHEHIVAGSQPRIVYDDGCLTIESAQDRNISFRLKGSASLQIDGINLMAAIKDRRKHFIPASEVPISVQIDTTTTQLFGRNGLDNRVQKLENNTRNSNLQRTVLIQRRLVRNLGKLNRLENQLKADNCKDDPCKNGGTCLNLFANFRCLCPNNWQGPTCEEDIDECALFANSTLGCQNGGTCVNTPGSYRCQCRIGFSGLHCIDSFHCLSAPPGELCGHGTCVEANTTSGYDCLCDQGWERASVSGVSGAPMPCTADIDECSILPLACASATCINLPGSFRCGGCPAGMTGNGFHCVDVNECLINNGGCSLNPRVLCINTEGSYNCGSCPLGWIGDGRSCTKAESNACNENNRCHPQASCQVISNMAVCTCPRGMEGDGYGPYGCRIAQISPCDPNPCKNGGTCTAAGNSYTCQCLSSSENVVKYSPVLNCEIQEDPCASSPCMNGGTCMSNMTSFAFTCLCPRALTGTFCTVDRRGCGRILRSATGTLKFPNMDTYGHNERCAWVIRTTIHKVLNITFTKFDLEDSTSCVFDWLQMHDGRSSAAQIIGRFCGNKLPKGGNIISTHNEVYLWFRSDNTSSHEGFELNWNTIDPVCGGIIDATTYGTIRSPGYPASAPPKRQCEWVLKAPFGKAINLVFYSINFGATNTCNEGYVDIFSGGSNTGELLAKYCNATNPGPLRSPTHELTIFFETGLTNTGSSFQLHYSVVEGVIGCGGLYTQQKGEFESPSLANRYVDSLDCEYYILQPNYTFIRIHFMEFDLRGNLTCDAEAVELYEGNKNALVRRWCGGSIPLDYNSTSNSLLIRYYSRGFLPSKFRARYELGCGDTFQNRTGSIKSPGYPNNYLKNLNCVYTIEAPVGYAVSLITITFQLKGLSWQTDDFKIFFPDMTSSSIEERECWTDSLTIYDGTLNNNNKIGKYCSSRIPVRILSKMNHMMLVFNTKDFGTDKGFSFVYSFTNIRCGGIAKATEGFIESPVINEGEIVDDAEICRWILTAPDGYGISLNFDRFDLMQSNNCSQSYLEILNNATLQSDVIGRYCGETFQPNLRINSNLITIVYRSKRISDGFKISYKYYDERNDCGGTYSAPVGIIHSPGTSDMYLPSKDCFWLLQAPVGSQIQLTVKNFSIEESMACIFDFLEIRNGMAPDSPLIGSYCGKTIPHNIPSFTNHLYLHFRSDGTYNSGGFELQWQRLSSRCGGVLDSYMGTIVSPHYPELVTSAAKCKWHIIVNKGSTINIQIKQIGISNDACLENHLQVFDGSIADYNQLSFNCTPGVETTIHTTGNEAVVVYTSHIDDNIGGFILNYTINCNQKLHQQAGIIESPNFPNPYPNAVNCKWKIIGEKGQRIAIDVSYFGMDPLSSTNCYDYLEVIDIKDGEVLERQKYCSAKPDAIESIGETVVLNFHTDRYDQGSGFHLEYQMKGCGETYSKPFGKIESPNFPYALDVNCVWVIKSEIGSSIQLTLSVELNTNDNCSANSLLIGTGPDGMYEIARYCQTMSKHVLTVPGHEIYVRFKTDRVRLSKGFKADYARLRSSCGGKLQALSGTIYSPNYPKSYSNNVYCEWVLDLRKLNFKFTTLDLEPNCTNDYVAFYVVKANYTDLLLEKVCGSILTNFTEYIPEGFQLKIVFRTNEATTGKGFALQYEEECFKFLQARSDIGVISKFMNQKSCTYALRNTNPGTKVMLTVTEANCDESASTNPMDSYFTIDINSGPLRFCHDHPPPIIIDDTDISLTLPSGTFTATYTTLATYCGGNFSSLQGKISSPYYPNSYPENIECVWNIYCRPGNSLQLSFLDMKITKSEHCNEDYVEIREGNSTGKLLGLYCQDSLPAMIISYDSIWIKFRSDVESGDKGFLAAYSYAYYTELNGTKGRIQSPPPGTNDNTYKWRITVALGNVIYLYVREYVQGLQLFDGFDETALELTLDADTAEITSSTSVLFITSNRGGLQPFLFDWEAVTRKPRNESKHDACGQETLFLSTRNTINITSPGFPFGYPKNVDCEWILSCPDGFHVALILNEIDLENSVNCVADFVEVSSGTDLITWKSEQKRCISPPSKSYYNIIHGTPYLKVNFHSDGYNNGTGFKAFTQTACGSKMTKPQGEIRSANISFLIGVHNCSWEIQVRPGKKIQFHLKINQKGITMANPYIYIRNGIDKHSPPLGAGRFSMNEDSSIPQTSSNRAFIFFQTYLVIYYDWVLTYKEVSELCGDDIVLNRDNDTITIRTPNYPNIPNPFTECTWIVRAPSTESINVTFIDRFDLSAKQQCQDEYLEVFDGATSLSNLIGIFCNNPKYLASTGNFIRLHYATTIPDPRNGFSALIGINKCGGTYTGFAGEVKSLNYPKIAGYPTNTICEYRIKLNEAYRVNLTFNDIDLPYSENSTEIDHLIIYPVTNNEPDLNNVLARIDGNSHVSTMSFNVNEILIKFITFGVNIKHRGFRITYRSMYGRCGSTHTGEGGEIVFPSSQNRNRIKTCTWRIMAPKGQQVKVEIQTLAATGNFSLQFYNDFRSYSLIVSVTQNYTEPIFSTSSIMFVKMYTNGEVNFNLKYSSGSVSPCSRAHDEDSRTITSLSMRSYFCEYDFKLSGSETLATTISMQSTGQTRSNCFQKASVIFLSNTWLRVRNFCGNRSNEVVSLPFNNLLIQTRKLPIDNVSFSITYKRHNCGGVNSEFKDGLVITKPLFERDYGQLDCAWQLLTKTGKMNNVTIKNNFTADCDKEFVNIYADFFGNILVKKMCKLEPTFDYMFRRSFFVTYHAQNYSPTSNFTFEIMSASSSCGGLIFTFPSKVQLKQEDYKNNVECIWDVKALNGFHLELEFIDRFFLEQSVNCSKDFVEIVENNIENGGKTSKGRFCGRTLPKKISSSANQLQVIFRTDDSNVGDGFSFRVEALCGGIFNVTKRVQTISSPNYPTSYLPNMDCNYTLIAPKNQWIHITLKAVNLEFSPTCNMDRLTVYEIDKSSNSLQPTKTYCRIQHPVEIRSDEQILFNFKTDRYIEYEGFRLEYYLETCGGSITESAYIQSPVDKENHYPNNMDCYWNITAPANKTTAISFKYFQFETSMDCMSDYVEVYTTDKPQKISVKKLCGKLTGRISVIKTNKINITIHAHSDSYANERGFAAQISFVDDCDIHHFLTENNSTTINESGSQRDVIHCQKSFSAPEGYQIEIEFERFDLKFCVNCSCDFAEIHDGDHYAEIIGRYCGNILPGKIISTRNNLTLSYTLGSLEANHNIRARVKAVKSLCDNRVIDLKDSDTTAIILKSPEINGYYPPNIVCYWTIKLNYNTIHIHFDKFDLQASGGDSDECKDYLEINDAISFHKYTEDYLQGPSPFYENLGISKRLRFCGNDTPSDYYAMFSPITVKFKSDSSIQHRGFQLSVNAAKACHKNFTSSAGRIFGSTYSCEFYIIAPDGYTISIHFLGYFEIAGTNTKVYDANTNTLINKTLANPIFPNTNKIRIEITSQMLFFYDLTYWATNAGLGCGGKFYGAQGSLSSPLFPSVSKNASTCRWDIQTAKNSRINFNFQTFDMGAKINCNSDYLQLIDYNTQGEPEVARQYCGDDNPAKFESKTNRLAVVYNKSVHFDGTGWRADFSSTTI